MTVPAQKPGRSRQDFGTPDDFIAAVKSRLGIDHFAVDLAADASNTKAPLFFSAADDSLQQDWRSWKGKGWCWLNPEFANIAPWAKKCADSAPTKIPLLVPAAVGSNWFRDYVDGKAYVLLLNGRLCFDGKNPYPKDCILCLYGVPPGYEVWDWRRQTAPR